MQVARAEASDRGAAIAEDARELLAHGYDFAGAADRLGVPVDRVHTELRRHPAPGQAAA
jgi:hypothetical protein